MLNLISLMDEFQTDHDCREALESIRWPNGVHCAQCGSIEVFRIPKRNCWECKGCGRQFSVTSGTIMHDSHLPLRKWFIAIYLMCESKKGISANQIKRTLGIQYRTAWYLCHRIRQAMGNEPLEGPTLVGIVEVDETMIGGKATLDKARALWPKSLEDLPTDHAHKKQLKKHWKTLSPDFRIEDAD